MKRTPKVPDDVEFYKRMKILKFKIPKNEDFQDIDNNYNNFVGEAYKSILDYKS